MDAEEVTISRVKVRQIFLILFIVFTLIRDFTGLSSLAATTGILMIFNGVIVFPEIDRKSKIINLLLLVVGAGILINERVSLSDFVAAYAQNASLLMLFLTVPLIGLPLTYGNFNQELDKIYGKLLRTQWSFYLFTSFITHFLSLLLNLAAIPLVLQLAGQHASRRNPQLLATAVLRGYAPAAFWSPNFVAVALVLKLLGLPWIQLALGGLLLGVLAVLLGTLVHLVDSSFTKLQVKEDFLSDTGQSPEPIEWTSIIRLALMVLTLIGTIVLVNYTTDWSMATAVSVVALVLPWLWAILFRQTKQHKQAVKTFFSTKFLNAKMEIVLFGLIGLLGAAMETIPFNVYFSKFLGVVTSFEHGGIFILSLALIYLISIAALVGVHPLVSLTILLLAVNPATIGLSHRFVGYLLLGGYGMALINSPFSGTTLLVSGHMERSPWEVTLKWNKFHLLLYPSLLVGLMLILGF